MVKKALTRRGIAISSDDSIPVVIEARQDGMTVNGLKVGSIEELLDRVTTALNIQI